MKKWVLFFIFFPLSLNGWNGPDHQLLGKKALEAVASDWGLNRPVEVQPLKSFLDKISKDPWSFSNWLGIDPAIDIEKPVPELLGKESVLPIDILSFYSIDPDDGRDQNLFDRDEKGRPVSRYPDQKWFGGLEGSDSQAFRHIEKPPFSLKHPHTTFGFPFWSVGEATRRAEIWFLLSELAFELGEDYWGWRFLANSFHYLQDLHNPYHAAQITPPMMASGLVAYAQWGRQQDGFVGTFAHLISNSHRFFESYVSDPGGNDNGLKEEAVRGVGGNTLLPYSESVENIAKKVRDESNLLFPSLIEAVTEATDEPLLGPYRFKSDGPEADDPAKFLKKGPRFQEMNQRIFSITKERFRSAGTVLRSVVKKSLDERGKKKPEELIGQLNHLLGSQRVDLDS